MKSSGALAAYMGFAPLAAFAAPAMPRPVRAGKTLVVLFLRGGADGLNIIVPHADSGYAGPRPTIAVPGPASGASDRCVDLDGFFGLHPALSPLMPHFDSGLAVAAHAVGYDRNTRSHFEEQDVWETGIIGNTVSSDGWLNRHLASSVGRGPIRAVSVGDALPRILHGDAPAYAIRGVDDLSLKSERRDPAAIAAALEHAYCCKRESATAEALDLLNITARTTIEGMKILKSVSESAYAPVAPYPETQTAQRLKEVARLIKADIGLEVAEVDFNGWDTHNSQGGGGGGALGTLLNELAGGVAAFLQDLESRADDVVLVTMSDFGRTAAENGTQGTDHGWANCMLLAGGPVLKANQAAAARGAPRKVAGQWPGLNPDQLNEGRDLKHTTDFRDVLSELVTIHLGNEALPTVLPSHQFKPVGLIA